MLPLGMVITFVGYGIATYGFLMVKGYNITFKEWFSPLHPFQGALDSKGFVPQGQLFPGPTPGAGGGGLVPGQGGGVAPANPQVPFPTPKGGKCPAGYTLVNGKCIPNAQQQPGLL
jgi:hypothetical protein